MFNKKRFLALLGVAILGGFPTGASSHERYKAANDKAGSSETTTPTLWREPADIASRDLLEGPGGKDHEPHPPFKFEKEDLKGSNPKFDVRDQDGVKWKVKLGAEAKPETVASRFGVGDRLFYERRLFSSGVSCNRHASAPPSG
jgi:hypothetical protein